MPRWAVAFGGLAVSVVPWLLCGGTLVLHQPFDASVFAEQCAANRCDTVIVPGPMIAPLGQAGYLTSDDGIRHVIGLWRAPERLAHAPVWHDHSILLTDIQVFGEAGRHAGELPGPRRRRKLEVEVE